MLNYYNWTEITSLSSDFLWLNSIISWEDNSTIILNEFLIPLTIITAHYAKTYFTISSLTSNSILDLIILNFTPGSLNFINFFYLDFLIELNSMNFQNYFIFHNSTGDSLTNYFITNPEIIAAANQLMSNFSYYSINNVSIFYDSFNLNLTSSVLDFVIFYWWLAIAVIFTLILMNSLVPSSLFSNISNNFFVSKVFIFINTFSFENRLQLDWSLTFLIFILFIWFSLLMSYDDVNVELVELTHFFIVIFFIFIITYLLFKYSIHYFAFLENSVSEGFSTAFIAKQFVRDISNTFALFLRFFLLMFRLNIYDGLDDFLDSYYIFFIDFDEDSYLDELFYFTDFFYFFTDNREDIIFYQNTEFDWWLDIYSKYFILFGKIFYFWAFILEEAFRISLALYISYLIIFEVHAVNVSNTEDNFFNSKKK